MNFKRLSILFLPIFLALISIVLLADLLRASGAASAGDGREIVVVADTTASMQPELDAVVLKWPGRVIANIQKERQFHLVEYGESFRYLGNSNDIKEFRTRLSRPRY